MRPIHTILVAEPSDLTFVGLTEAFEAERPLCALHRGRDGVETIGYLAGEGRFADRWAHPLPKLLLLDFNVTEPDGPEVLKWLQKRPDLKTLVTIVFDCWPKQPGVNLAYRLGANSFLKKPEDPISYAVLARTVVDYWLSWNTWPDSGSEWQH